MASRKTLLINLTDDQRDEVRTEFGKEVTSIIFRLVGGSQLIVDISDVAITVEERLEIRDQ